MNKYKLILQSLDLIIEHALWPEKKPSEIFNILMYVNEKGWLYTPNKDGKIIAIVCAYRIQNTEGDSLLINVRFIAKSTSTTGLIDVSLDIGGSQGIITEQTVSIRKGVGNEQRVNIIFDVFTGTTFLANQGQIKITSIVGDTDIYNVVFKVTRVFKGG